MHILNVYLEPGQESFVIKRADTVVNLAKDIIRQDPTAKIMLGGDLNGQLNKLHTYLRQAGFPLPSERRHPRTGRATSWTSCG